jgi:hypothetical protein
MTTADCFDPHFNLIIKTTAVTVECSALLIAPCEGTQRYLADPSAVYLTSDGAASVAIASTSFLGPNALK